jgi:C-terminal processing protease CtpA/Prc
MNKTRSLVSIPPDNKRLTVTRLLDDSPALAAGVRVGDEIESVNGTPVGDIGLPALRERLRLDGREIKMELLHGSERLTVAFKTRRMI